MDFIFLKKPRLDIPGTGLCTFSKECNEPVELQEVRGRMIITDGKNTIKFVIINNKIIIATDNGDDDKGEVKITLQEVKEGSFNMFRFREFQTEEQQRTVKRHYQLNIGNSFITQFVVVNNEFSVMAKKMDSSGNYEMGDVNVIYVKIAFKTEGQLITSNF